MKLSREECLKMAEAAGLTLGPYGVIGNFEQTERLIHAADEAAEKRTAAECAEICDKLFRESERVSTNGALWCHQEISSRFNLNQEKANGRNNER
jgi:hypothetical protein